MVALGRGMHHCDGAARPLLMWRFATPMLAISSASVGGGVGLRSWALNAQVPHNYARTDLAAHVRAIAHANDCTGDGVGMLTAADVDAVRSATDQGIEVWATSGLGLVTWAAAADGDAQEWRPGTINVFAALPVRCTEAALVNAVMTATEAKTQALVERGVPGTGTPSDALCIVCPASGEAEVFAGPRSPLGAALGRAAHAAIAEGIAGAAGGAR